MALKKSPRLPPPVQQPLFEPVKAWKRPAKPEARRLVRGKRLPKPQLLLYEDIHLDRLMPRLLNNEVIFQTTKLKLKGKTKTIKVGQEVRKCLASILRMRGVNADALVGLLVEGTKERLFMLQTQAQIVGIMKRGETIGKVQYIPVRPAARTEAENKILNEALARIALFVQRAVNAKFERSARWRPKI